MTAQGSNLQHMEEMSFRKVEHLQTQVDANHAPEFTWEF